MYTNSPGLKYGPLGRITIEAGKVIEYETAGQAYGFEVRIYYDRKMGVSLILATNYSIPGLLENMKKKIVEQLAKYK